MERFRYWSTHRPVSIGTYPREYGVIEIANFRQRKMVPEINAYAFGFIDFENELPRSEQDHYDLRPEVKVDPELERIAKGFASALKRGKMDAITKAIDLAYSKGLIEDEDELVKAAQAYM